MLLCPRLLDKQISADTSATRRLAHHRYQRIPIQQHVALGYQANVRWPGISATSHKAPAHHKLLYELLVVSWELWSLDPLLALRYRKFVMCLHDHSSYSIFYPLIFQLYRCSQQGNCPSTRLTSTGT